MNATINFMKGSTFLFLLLTTQLMFKKQSIAKPSELLNGPLRTKLEPQPIYSNLWALSWAKIFQCLTC